MVSYLVHNRDNFTFYFNLLSNRDYYFIRKPEYKFRSENTTLQTPVVATSDMKSSCNFPVLCREGDACVIMTTEPDKHHTDKSPDGDGSGFSRPYPSLPSALWTAPHHEDVLRSGRIAPCILDLSTRWRSASRPGLFTPRVRSRDNY
jgi:hypothetical protein